MPISRFSTDGSLPARLMWLVRVRWISVLLLLASVFVGHFVGFISHHFVVPSLAIALGLAIWNLLTERALRRYPVTNEWQLAGQLAIDALVLTLALACSGGSTNPLIPIVLIHASLGPIFLKRQGPAYAFGAMALGCIAFLAFQTIFPLAPSHIHASSSTLFASFVASGSVIWMLTHWLAKTMDKQEAALQFLKDRNMRLDHLRAMGALSAGFAHEFATPLNTIQIRLERLRRKLPEELRGEADAALEKAADCERTLRDFMQAGIEPENLELRQVDLGNLIPTLAEQHANARGLPSPKISKPSGSSIQAELPLMAFSQTIMNLLDNAIEHGSPDEIRVSLGSSDGICFVEIRDAGDGFPVPVLENIGKPFLTTSEAGTGLGLYNALVLAQTLGGSLSIRNDSGGVVRFEIPTGGIGTP